MPNRAAIIDLGTNTFHILIMEWEGHNYRIIDKLQVPVKLGKGAFDDMMIKKEAYSRGIATIIEFKNIIETYDVIKVEAFGTSILRNAKNGFVFKQEAEEILGYPIRIIDGQIEAEWIYQGVRHAVPMSGELHLIMDIGGGSVEFIIADGRNIYWKKSFEIGAARLIEKFPSSEPMDEMVLAQLQLYIEKQLAALWPKAQKYQIRSLIGASGSFESVASMEMELYHSAQQAPHFMHHIIDLSYFEEIYRRIRNSTREELENTPGLPQFRVEMIMVAMVLIRTVIHRLKIQKVIVSDYALKEGVMFSIMDKVAESVHRI